MKRTFTKYPQGYVRASEMSRIDIDTSKSLGEFSEEEIAALPSKFCARTRIPGGHWGNTYTILSKENFIKNPDSCFRIDSYWGYARARDIYLASREQIDNYKQKELQAMEQEKEQFLNIIRDYYKYIVG